ncbi:MAG: hypothetical protein JWO59_1743, partial [Chloroflexi bacterium]|nr:hypothetical protein [Chloroflexota bacterium]
HAHFLVEIDRGKDRAAGGGTNVYFPVAGPHCRGPQRVDGSVTGSASRGGSGQGAECGQKDCEPDQPGRWAMGRGTAAPGYSTLGCKTWRHDGIAGRSISIGTSASAVAMAVSRSPLSTRLKVTW